MSKKKTGLIAGGIGVIAATAIAAKKRSSSNGGKGIGDRLKKATHLNNS